MSNANDFVIENGVLKKYTGTESAVVIPDGVTVVEEECFWDGFGYDCVVKEITLPSSLEDADSGTLTVRENFLLVYSPLEVIEALYAETFIGWKNEAGVLFETESEEGEKIALCFNFGYGSPKYDNGIFEEFTEDGLNLEKYDKTRTLRKGDALILAAICRLTHPYKLSEECSDFYSGVLLKNIKKAAGWICHFDKVEWLEMLCSLSEGNKKAQTAVADIINSADAEKCKEFLSSYVFLDEKAAPAEKKSTAKEKTASDHPTEKFCKENYSEKEIKDVMKKAGGSMRNLGKVKYKDSSLCASEFAVSCAIASYMKQMTTRPKSISRYKTDCISVKIDEMADSIVEAFDEKSFREALVSFCDIELAYAKPQRLLPFCRFADGSDIAEVIKKINLWANWDRYSSSGRSAIIVARGAIMLSDSREAMLYIEKCKKLYTYARIRGMNEDTLRDTKLSDFGLDANGCKQFDLGNTVIEATLAQDLTITLYDKTAEKTVKSLPKKGADPEKHEAASKELSELKKNLKKIVKSRNNVLFEKFLSGSTQKAADWIAAQMNNPVLHCVAELIVWSQNSNTFILTKDGAVDCNGEAYQISENHPICVAHPIEMKEAELSAWQKYFASKGLRQPFEQIWEPVVDVNSIKPDRYENCMIPFYRFKDKEAIGIRVYDTDFHNQIDITFDGCDAVVPRIDVRRHELYMDDRFEIASFVVRGNMTRKLNHLIAYLDRIVVYDKVKQDDANTLSNMVSSFTLAQISDFIKVAIENNATNVTALLLEYKNTNFEDYGTMDEFVL